MAKQGGMGDQLFVGGYDIGGDVISLGRIGGGPNPLVVTGITKSAPERLGGVRDGAMDVTSWFNPAADQGHDRFSTLPTADTILTYCRGTTLGNPSAAINAKQVNYDPNRGNDGSFTFAVQALSNGFGLEWGRQLTAGKRTDTTATNGASVDHTAVSTAFGWQAYLHVFAFTGTSVTVTLEDSANDTDFVALTGGAFTAATGITSQRIQGARDATVRRYIRAVTSGTFSNAIFAVTFMRNDVSTVF